MFLQPPHIVTSSRIVMSVSGGRSAFDFHTDPLPNFHIARRVRLHLLCFLVRFGGSFNSAAGSTFKLLASRPPICKLAKKHLSQSVLDTPVRVRRTKPTIGGHRRTCPRTACALRSPWGERLGQRLPHQYRTSGFGEVFSRRNCDTICMKFQYQRNDNPFISTVA